jgi:CelD/BcsL family acetyltransferase involved in cellulose biosynthesis
LTVDLSRGLDGWSSDLEMRGSKAIRKIARAERILESQHGPVTFCEHCTSLNELTDLMNCKSGQYRRTGNKDRFATPWIRAALESLHRRQEPRFAGVLSTLSVKGKTIAAHFGLRSELVWHYWFPCHSQGFSKHSPGLILIKHMVERAAALRIQSFDFGAGDFDYKLRLATHSVPLVEASIGALSP